MKRRGGPSVQQWIDSIPSTTVDHEDIIVPVSTSTVTTTTATTTLPEHSINNLYINTPIMTVSTPKKSAPSSPSILPIQTSPIHGRLVRDPSLQSDSSHCSSVESLLELRKADPEAILLGLGFGGCTNTTQDNGPLSRIPKRFLQPSKLKGITINDFVKQQQETSESIDSASLGYRGLTGSPFVAPSEIVQKIMERLREHESHEIDAYTAFHTESYNPLQMQDGRLSVLSPDSRQFIQRSRSISPDMRNKRMIIGQKSFAFGCDGDLIEINPLNLQNSTRKINLTSSDYENNDINIFTTNSSFNNYMNEASIDKFDTSESYSETDSSTIDQRYQTRKISENKLPLKNIDDRNNNSSGIEIKISSESCKIQEGDWDKVDELLESPRRASFCDVSEVFNSKIDENEERRFSDGLISDVPIIGEMKKRKKNSLRRQARISDAEAIEYCGGTDESTEPNTSSSSSGDKRNNLETTGRKQTLCDTKKQHLCCKNDELGQICGHEEGCKDCCYHASNTSCWKKMKKIIQKNQKLENMVVKSRQEMAEIREMLNNVLSIRMEPGF